MLGILTGLTGVAALRLGQGFVHRAAPSAAISRMLRGDINRQTPTKSGRKRRGDFLDPSCGPRARRTARGRSPRGWHTHDGRSVASGLPWASLLTPACVGLGHGQAGGLCWCANFGASNNGRLGEMQKVAMRRRRRRMGTAGSNQSSSAGERNRVVLFITVVVLC